MSAEPAAKNNLHIRAPGSLTTAIREAADREMTTASAYVRRAIIRQLREDGLDPAAYAPNQAGAA